MSDKDSHPAQGDGVRPVYPMTFFGKGEERNPSITDFRPEVLPADAPEEEDPKVSSAPESVASSVSQTVIEVTAPVSPAPAPVVKANSPSKAVAPGKPASSGPGKTGS